MGATRGVRRPHAHDRQQLPALESRVQLWLATAPTRLSSLVQLVVWDSLVPVLVEPQQERQIGLAVYRFGNEVPHDFAYPPFPIKRDRADEPNSAPSASGRSVSQ